MENKISGLGDITEMNKIVPEKQSRKQSRLNGKWYYTFWCFWDAYLCVCVCVCVCVYRNRTVEVVYLS